MLIFFSGIDQYVFENSKASETGSTPTFPPTVGAIDFTSKARFNTNKSEMIQKIGETNFN